LGHELEPFIVNEVTMLAGDYTLCGHRSQHQFFKAGNEGNKRPGKSSLVIRTADYALIGINPDGIGI
jgi:hypothetical protein